MKRKIILDCDPGHDDAVAILLAGISEKIDLLGIVSVAGNSYVENTTRNALILTEMGKINVPVFQGSAKPLIRDQIVAPDIHGESGLEGANLPLPTKKVEEKNYLEFMAEKVKENPGKITFVAVGPLTNIAKFALNYPELVSQVEELVIMGGGIEFGNVKPRAEFNIYADPEAAQIVFNAGFNLTVFPLDVTHQAKIHMNEIKEMQKFSSEIVSKMGILLEFFHQTYYDVFKIEGAPLHDPCTIAYLIKPELFEFKEYYAQVEVKGELTYGETVVDYWQFEKPNSKWALKVNREEFIKLLFEELKKY
ncbi:uridine nucleosidase [Marinitoga sp. 1135]|uniref:Inosine-uridine nucleoside N-ribohydrolase n=1 Tax=Marinitoga piezophila (strain DSM 14283 / JCM 11233 / KA3) TaxID=443254 RepID=H2J3H1_MARPK|nr:MULTISPECIES: nucleoside hydrolase [Marinitoga]AEX85787.1 Inosine-uridine nucleoside N-ribohydrolase [Marinitoga piezophila KA3]APT76229.1 uridine nucleosidase [Marinitoga sp. 1137]NUU95988.1 uridine nucleosidase [Marinitoga sp. 1135]NUU97900.1 uridine nucleosidase [Marinitoga sp. 1138]